MTNEVEKTFFDTFGIEPSTKYDYCWKSEENKDKLYPPITDRILLGLICIANEYGNYSETTNMKNIKERTLRILLKAEKFYDKNCYSSDRQYKKLIKRVRTLFEKE